MNVIAQLFQEIDSCEYLFLREIAEPHENKLRLMIEEAETGELSSIKLPGLGISEGRPIRSTPRSKLFEVYWDFYVAYSVRNESFVSRDESEVFSGKSFRVYSKSRFLDYVQSATFACEQHPGPLTHVGVVCQNHIIDVVSTQPPAIRNLRA